MLAQGAISSSRPGRGIGGRDGVRASLISRVTTSAAGSAPASSWAWPAQRFTRSGFTGLARCRAQRGGDVMNLRIGGGRTIAVIDHEPVDDPAGRFAGERARHRGRRAARHGRAMNRRPCPPPGRAGSGADLGRDRSGAEHRGDAGSGRDPAGGHQRQFDPRPHQGQQRQQAVGRLIVVDRRAAVAARLETLHHQPVGAGGCCVEQPPQGVVTVISTVMPQAAEPVDDRGRGSIRTRTRRPRGAPAPAVRSWPKSCRRRTRATRPGRRCARPLRRCPARTAHSLPAAGIGGRGVNTFTASGAEVRCRNAAICSATASGDL